MPAVADADRIEAGAIGRASRKPRCPRALCTEDTLRDVVARARASPATTVPLTIDAGLARATRYVTVRTVTEPRASAFDAAPRRTIGRQ